MIGVALSRRIGFAGRLPCLALLSVALWACPVFAGDFAIDAPLVIDEPVGSKELWFKYEYIDENLDFLNFSDNASTTSRLIKESAVHLGVNWRLSERYAMRLAGFRRTADIARMIEPTRIEGKQVSVSVALQRLLGDGNSALQIMLNHFDVSDITIEKYQQGNIVLGEDVMLLDPDSLSPLPVASLGMQEKGAELGYFRHIPVADTSYYLSLHYRFSNIEPDVSSVLFDVTDPTFLNATVNGQVVGEAIQRVQDTLPQNSDWQEHIWSASIALSRPLNERWSTTWSLRGYAIFRDNYQQGPAEDEINHNFVLNGYLSWSPKQDFALYVNGRIHSNYLAGTDPGVYNRRIAHMFDNFYGTLSVGAMQKF